MGIKLKEKKRLDNLKTKRAQIAHGINQLIQYTLNNKTKLCLRSNIKTSTKLSKVIESGQLLKFKIKWKTILLKYQLRIIKKQNSIFS